MNDRFALYVKRKKLTLKGLSELSGVSLSTIGRFCNGGIINSDNLLRLLHVCDDLSLEWLFFGTGGMFRTHGHITNNNYAAFAGSEVNNSGIIDVGPDGSKTSPVTESVLREKERVISEKDDIIMEKDRVILRLSTFISEFLAPAKPK
jgi:transcriptional regulator with XRE-family HTH domain